MYFFFVSNNLSQPPEKWIKEKESKKKKPVQVELKPSEEKIEECPQELAPVCEAPKEETKDGESKKFTFNICILIYGVTGH